MTTPAPIDALIRHFTDLREGNHFGHITRTDKETAFAAAVELLDAPARRVLSEFTSICCAAPVESIPPVCTAISAAG